MAQAFDEAVGMKVLSRVEGDAQAVPPKWLDALREAVAGAVKALPGYDEESCGASARKLAEMKKRLETTDFTSFWR